MFRLPFDDDEQQKPIFARSGWEIPQPHLDEIRSENRNQSIELMRIRTQALLDSMARNHKQNLKLRSLSPFMYNCVGMIFCNRRAWINIDHIYDILKEDGYTKIPPENAMVGDVVVYTQNDIPSHVGLVTTVHESVGNILNMRVLSKWGKDGEIEHHLEDVPQFCGQPTAYYSEKQL